MDLHFFFDYLTTSNKVLAVLFKLNIKPLYFYFVTLIRLGVLRVAFFGGEGEFI